MSLDALFVPKMNCRGRSVSDDRDRILRSTRLQTRLTDICQKVPNKDASISVNTSSHKEMSENFADFYEFPAQTQILVAIFLRNSGYT